MTRLLLLLALAPTAAAFLALAGPAPARSDDSIRLTLRSRAAAPGREPVAPTEKEAEWDPKKTALIICDMWDDHWCKSAAQRVGEMAGPLNEVVKTAREKGVFIIHAPSDTMSHYEGHPARRRMIETPEVDLPEPLPLPNPPLPVDASDGG